MTVGSLFQHGSTLNGLGAQDGDGRRTNTEDNAKGRLLIGANASVLLPLAAVEGGRTRPMCWRARLSSSPWLQAEQNNK